MLLNANRPQTCGYSCRTECPVLGFLLPFCIMHNVVQQLIKNWKRFTNENYNLDSVLKHYKNTCLRT